MLSKGTYLVVSTVDLNSFRYFSIISSEILTENQLHNMTDVSNNRWIQGRSTYEMQKGKKNSMMCYLSTPKDD